MAAIIAVSAAAFVELCRCRLCPILPPSPIRTKLRTRTVVELGSVAPPRAPSLTNLNFSRPLTAQIAPQLKKWL